MSIIVIYFIKLLCLPPMSLLVLAWLGLQFKCYRHAVALSRVCLFMVLVLSLPAVVNRWALHWEHIPALQPEQIECFKPQAIVVLGGGLEGHVTEYPLGKAPNDRTLLRIRYAAKIARTSHLPVLASGGSVFDDGISESQVMADVLEQEFNVPVTWREHRSHNTMENAKFSHELLHQAGITRIVLVTQAFHMPRALKAFEVVGFEVLPAPTAFIGHAADIDVLDYLPSASALKNSYFLAHESIGMLWYGTIHSFMN